MLAIGVMIWLGSELMFFSGLFAALFTIRAHLASWPPVGTHLDVLQSGIFTIVLIASSFTMQRAVWLIENRRRAEARTWVIATMIMGTLFVSNQAYEWTHLATRWYTNSYGSIFFITTGLHGLHVILASSQWRSCSFACVAAKVTPVSCPPSRASVTTGTSSTSYGSGCTRPCSC